MTKTNSKKIVLSVMVAALALTVMPSITLAVARDPQATTTLNAIKEKRNDNICENIDKFYVASAKKMAENEAKYLARKQELNENWIKRLEDRKSRQEQAWKAADLTRDNLLKKLEAKATTDAQKAAVAAYKTAVTGAVSARRTAIDAAVADFNAKIAAAIATRKAGFDKALATYKTAVTAAQDKAKAACTAGTDAKTVRTQLRAELKIAKDALKAEVKALDKIKVNISPLVGTKKEAFAKINAEYKAAIKKAQADLKAAFVTVKTDPAATTTATTTN